MTKTLLSSMLLAGLVAMAAAQAQDSDPPDTTVEAVAMGEGEVRISEALANALVESGEAADFDAALETVLALREEGMGWGEIAKELGFDNLGLIVADAASEGRSSAGLAIAEENRGRGDAEAEVEGEDSGAARAGAGAETAASARAQGEVGRAIGADARANARIEAGARGTTSGRPAGVGAPTLPQQVTRPATAPVRPAIPVRPTLPERPQRGGRGGGG
jgi:hypothetical protein